MDLEDAVEHLAKDSAREALCDFLGTHPQARLWVRINDAATPWHEDDLRRCAAGRRDRHPAAQGRKPGAGASCGTDGLPVIPIIETARGVLNLAEVAATPGVARLAWQPGLRAGPGVVA